MIHFSSVDAPLRAIVRDSEIAFNEIHSEKGVHEQSMAMGQYNKKNNDQYHLHSPA
jgi:hypothetical protein